jgi:hypothetical protein
VDQDKQVDPLQQEVEVLVGMVVVAAAAERLYQDQELEVEVVKAETD